MRLVSLTCSNTELVHALGCGDQLVGVDDHSDFPAALVAGLPRVGKDLDVDADAVAALCPDLVLASNTVPGHEKVVSRLLAHKQNVLVLAPTSLAHVARDARQLGGLLGVPGAGESLARGIESALSVGPAPTDAPRVLVEWWPRPCIAAGARSWVDDMLRCAGARNALSGEDVESRTLEPAEVRALAPDAVVVSWCGVPRANYRAARVLERAGWEAVPAVQNGQVHLISEAYLGRP
ncbi:MAG: helical backbone metal receptor, partial [Myxococcota bacterium]|nr:helical backbone metal receptor [Myxococcota bacterium]